MIEICQLTKRRVDPSKREKMSKELERVKIFSMSVGHGVGTVDFVECIDKIEEEEYFNMVSKCDEYGKFKLGNLSKYFEVEIFPEHAQKLVNELPNCKFKETLQSLTEGYIIVRKPV